MPEISVVIPCFNGNATLGLELEALSRQADAPDFEVIVSDNMSSIPPDPIVAQWESKLDIRVVRATGAQGISCARNVGVREAKSDKIILCDADDAAGPNFVRAAFEGLKQAPLVTGNVQRIEAVEFNEGLDHIWSLLDDHGAAVEDALDFDDSDVDPAYPILMGGACGLDRNAVLELDGWDQAFFPGVEDNDFALRAVAAGYTMGKSWAMTLAERRRGSNSAAFKREYDGGYMHMKLCAAHDLRKTSPNLRNPDWRVDLAKLPLAGLKVLASPRGQRDFLGLAGRTGLRTGQLRGWVDYRLRHASLERQPGIGLHEGP